VKYTNSSTFASLCVWLVTLPRHSASGPTFKPVVKLPRALEQDTRSSTVWITQFGLELSNPASTFAVTALRCPFDAWHFELQYVRCGVITKSKCWLRVLPSFWVLVKRFRQVQLKQGACLACESSISNQASDYGYGRIGSKRPGSSGRLWHHKDYRQGQLRCGQAGASSYSEDRGKATTAEWKKVKSENAWNVVFLISDWRLFLYSCLIGGFPLLHANFKKRRYKQFSKTF